MGCEDIEIEAIADGTRAATAEEADHLRTCAGCARGLELARAIESLLATRESPAPPPAFTAGVMARIGAAEWHTERIVDLGFNVAVALGLVIIMTSGAGLAWSIGLFTISIDLDALELAVGQLLDGRIGAQVQTTVFAAVLLVATLGLWWWAESDSAA
jgi:hypothetical protein